MTPCAAFLMHIACGNSQSGRPAQFAAGGLYRKERHQGHHILGCLKCAGCCLATHASLRYHCRLHQWKRRPGRGRTFAPAVTPDDLVVKRTEFSCRASMIFGAHFFTSDGTLAFAAKEDELSRQHFLLHVETASPGANVSTSDLNAGKHTSWLLSASCHVGLVPCRWRHLQARPRQEQP